MEAIGKTEVEELPGCMCAYLPDELRNQINFLAEECEAYPHQVVTMSLQIGLAVLIGKHTDLLRKHEVKGGRGEIKQIRRSKLSGKGV